MEVARRIFRRVCYVRVVVYFLADEMLKVKATHFITCSMSISPSTTRCPPYLNAAALAKNINASDKPNDAPCK